MMRDRIFGARIVRGDDDEVAQPGGDRSHQRPLRAIAIAAAAEHRNHSLLSQRPRRLQQVFQRIVGMRVVDHDSDVVVCARHDFKPARHAGEVRQPALDCGNREVQ